MTRKKKGLLLLALYALLIALAIPMHTQKGIEWNEKFYKKTAEGVFSAGKENQFSFVNAADGLQFDMIINGLSYQALMTQPDDNCYLFDFSDGWSLRMTGDYASPYMSINDSFIPLFGDVETQLIITDVENPAYQFAAYEIEKAPFYGENEQQLGEWYIYQTKDGTHLYGYEKWFDGSYSSSEPTFVMLSNGTAIDLHVNDSQTIYVNEQGEALLNADALFSFPGDEWSGDFNKYSYISLLLRAVNDDISARGHFVCFLMSLFYFLGLAQFLFPEELAFFGSRWQYRYEPELSDEGMIMAKLGGILIMLLSAGMLFAPLIL